MKGGSAPNRTLSAASLSPEREGPASSDSAGRGPKTSPAALPADLYAAVLPALASLVKPVLERVGDRVQHSVDVVARERQRCDGDHGDERDDQRVLDECLAFLGPHLRQLNPRQKRLNHVGSFLPS